MFGGINPKQMQGMMKKMGISQVEIPAEKVTIEKSDGNLIVVENPTVISIQMQGNTSFQISGDIKKISREGEISKEDIETIMEKTGCSFEKAKKTLEKTGDLAQAILELST